ncbi:unnamed protein product [Staurois parvus]|uniref:Uncharacterized protein n=1 Tax=Staurois parvus TaxID=386267 RepID=A0ABN9FJY2_9NEOB|nr:unnamed protein product [Staurois parvus]
MSCQSALASTITNHAATTDHNVVFSCSMHFLCIKNI